MKIEIIKPKVFPESEIISGVTTKNIKYFPEYGFSLSKGKILNDKEVSENRNLLALQLNTNPDKLKFQKQVHSDKIRIIQKDSTEEESDAMITNERGIIINILIADCAAVLLYDPEKKVIAGIHSGWRGSHLGIVKKGIKEMVSEFGCVESNLLAFVSPCASGDKYEVGVDVAELFPRYVAKIKEDKFLFDNRKKIVDDLLEGGILLRNMEVSDICTISNINFHSYRRDKDTSGRMSAYIGMR